MSVRTASGLQLPDRGEQLVTVSHPGQHLDLARVLEQPAGALANEIIIFGDHDPQPVSHEPAPRQAAMR